MTGKTYQLSMARDYVRHWGLKEAVRELIQNALDNSSSAAPFECTFAGDTLTITSKGASLSPRTLLLGATSKVGNPSAIGSFGEGYKLALLVLTRLGYPVKVHNGSRLWVPSFQPHPDYQEEMLVVTDTCASHDNQAVEFIVSGLSGADQEEIRETCLLLQPPMDDVISTALGCILPSRRGKLYVGGLFVCETQMTYGYDVLPQHLTLERDRQTVSSFDLKFLTERIWLQTRDWEKVCALMEQDAPDVEMLQYNSSPPSELAECAAASFERSNVRRIPVTSQAEADKYPVGSTAFVPRPYAHVIGTVPRIAAAMARASLQKTPRQALEAWLADHKKYLARLPKAAFKRLVEEAGNWKAAHVQDDCPF